MTTSVPSSIQALKTSNIEAFEEGFASAESAMGVAEAGVVLIERDLNGGDHGQYSDFFQPPKMRDVTDGSPEIHPVPFYDLRKKYREWKNPVQWKASEAADDRFGKWAKLFRAMGREAARFPIERATQIIIDNQLTYTGSALLGSHTVEGTAIDNTIGTTVTSTTAMTAADVIAVIDDLDGTMVGFQDWEGRPQGIRPNVIMVPGVHGNAFYRTFMGVNLVNGAGGMGSFVDAGMTQVFPIGDRLLWINPYLSSTTKIYGMHVTSDSSPLSFVIREEAEIWETDESSELYVRDSTIIQTGRMRGVEFAGSPYRIVETTISA